MSPSSAEADISTLGLDHHMSELSGHVCCPAKDLSVDNNSASDSGSKRQKQQIFFSAFSEGIFAERIDILSFSMKYGAR